MDNPSAIIHPRVLTAMAKDRGILDLYGMTVLRAESGACEISLKVSATLVNAGENAHGAVVFALMDMACAYSLGSQDVRGLTVNANTTYVKAAKVGAELTGKVKVASRTRRVATLRGEVFTASGGEHELIAHGTFVFQLVVAT